MSLQSLYESPNSKLINGAMGRIIFSGENFTVTAPAASVTLEVTISENLVEGDTYLVLWTVGGASTLGTDPFALDVGYDIAGQVEIIAETRVLETFATSVSSILFSGNSVFTVDAT